jgi:hypothetical protein
LHCGPLLRLLPTVTLLSYSSKSRHDLKSTSRAHTRNWQQLAHFCEWLYEGLSFIGDATLASVSLNYDRQFRDQVITPTFCESVRALDPLSPPHPIDRNVRSRSCAD